MTLSLNFEQWLGHLPIFKEDLSQGLYEELQDKARGQYKGNQAVQQYWTYIKNRYPEIATEAKSAIKGGIVVGNDGGGDWE